MKRIVSLICILTLCASMCAVAAEEKNTSQAVPYCIMRGFSNLLFGWTEIPRGLIYENVRMPVIGLISGTLKGSFLGLWRGFSGTIDVISIGQSKQGIYLDEMPDFVWESPCVPEPAQVK